MPYDAQGIPTDPLQTEDQFQALLSAARIRPSQHRQGAIAYLRRRLLGLSIAEVSASPSMLRMLLSSIEDSFHLVEGGQFMDGVGGGMFSMKWYRANRREREKLYRWAALEGTLDKYPYQWMVE